MGYRKQGYTLLELAIVLVIVGLLIGLVFAGQSLIHNSQLATVITAVDRYKKAVQMFKEKYNYLPGDMSGAAAMWGTDANCANQTLGANATPKTATCDGNGDGFIGDSTGTPTGTSTNWPETYRVWQQLADAGFIESLYTGALSSRTAGNNADPGMNIPISSIASNGFTLLYAAPTNANTTFYASNYGHIIVYGQPAGEFNSAYNPGLTTIDAASIDQKLDDGLPGTGNVLSFTPNLAATPNCATTAVPSTAVYNSANTTNLTGMQCSLIFILGF